MHCWIEMQSVLPESQQLTVLHRALLATHSLELHRVVLHRIVLHCVEHAARRILQHCQQVKWDHIALHRPPYPTTQHLLC